MISLPPLTTNVPAHGGDVVEVSPLEVQQIFTGPAFSVSWLVESGVRLTLRELVWHMGQCGNSSSY